MPDGYGGGPAEHVHRLVHLGAQRKRDNNSHGGVDDPDFLHHAPESEKDPIGMLRHKIRGLQSSNFFKATSSIFA